MVRPLVVVVGSINVDLVVSVGHLPLPGETVLGGSFTRHFGGKGANQAVAAARAGADVTMIGAVGEDGYGDEALASLTVEGVDTSGVRRVAGATGIALIVVGPRGENQIAVAPGANAALRPEDVALPRSDAGGVLLTNFEIPVPVAIAALRAAPEANLTAVLDPAPAHALSTELLRLGPILTPNEHEVTVAIGNDDAERAFDELVELHRGPVIVTQGAAGALLADGDRRVRFPGYRATVVDTTGAGDAFNGALAAWLAEGRSLDEAIEAGTAAGAISVGRPGARAGMPMRDELLGFIGQAARD